MHTFLSKTYNKQIIEVGFCYVTGCQISPAVTLAAWRSLAMAADGTSVRSAAL